MKVIPKESSHYISIGWVRMDSRAVQWESVVSLCMFVQGSFSLCLFLHLSLAIPFCLFISLFLFPSHSSGLSSSPHTHTHAHTGWWFDACGPSNLNGMYHSQGQNTGKLNGIRWHYFKGSSYSLRSTTMMIRPLDFWDRERRSASFDMPVQRYFPLGESTADSNPLYHRCNLPYTTLVNIMRVGRMTCLLKDLCPFGKDSV